MITAALISPSLSASSIAATSYTSASMLKVAVFSRLTTNERLAALRSWSKTIRGRLVIGREVAHPTSRSSSAPPKSMKTGSHQSERRWMNSLSDKDHIFRHVAIMITPTSSGRTVRRWPER